MLQMLRLSTTRSKTAGILRLGEGSDRKAILAGPKSFTNSRIGLLQSGAVTSRDELILTYLK